jgi:hypothetical protein
MEASVVAAIEQCGTRIFNVPPRYTSTLQPMDGAPNKQVKDALKRFHVQRARGVLDGTKTLPKRINIAIRVKMAWYEGVKRSTIQRTYRKIGFHRRNHEYFVGADVVPPVGPLAEYDDDVDDADDMSDYASDSEDDDEMDAAADDNDDDDEMDADN